MSALPPVPNHPQPVNGYWTARRARKAAVRRQTTVGTWLWRTGIATAVVALLWAAVGDDLVGRWRQQELRARLADGPAVPTGPAVTSSSLTLGAIPSGTTPQAATLVALPGEDFSADGPARDGSATDVVARLRIPDLDLDWVVGHGVGREDLKAGPGWMPGTAPPGQAGNSVISGHRTTFGAPFNRIDELDLGDRILVDVPGQPTAVYEVRDRFVVRPSEVGVVQPTGGARLTLTTCTPTGTADYRLIVQATQVAGPAAHLAGQWAPYGGGRVDDPALRQ